MQYLVLILRNSVAERRQGDHHLAENGSCSCETTSLRTAARKSKIYERSKTWETDHAAGNGNSK